LLAGLETEARMTFKVHVDPAQITIHQGETVLVTEPDGQINWPSERGCISATLG
jgi:hypothetical protein